MFRAVQLPSIIISSGNDLISLKAQYPDLGNDCENFLPKADGGPVAAVYVYCVCC